jgi:hypothetical protein
MDRGRTTRTRIVSAMKCQFNDALAPWQQRANSVGKLTRDSSEQGLGCLKRVFQIKFHRNARPLYFNLVSDTHRRGLAARLYAEVSSSVLLRVQQASGPLTGTRIARASRTPQS